MLRYECDLCHRLKEPDEIWILGFAAENIGVTSARREINISSRWDEDRAVEYLAVHFCSDACRQDYTARFFGPDAIYEESELEKVSEAAAVEEVLPRKAVTSPATVRSGRRTRPALKVIRGAKATTPAAKTTRKSSPVKSASKSHSNSKTRPRTA